MDKQHVCLWCVVNLWWVLFCQRPDEELETEWLRFRVFSESGAAVLPETPTGRALCLSAPIDGHLITPRDQHQDGLRADSSVVVLCSPSAAAAPLLLIEMFTPEAHDATHIWIFCFSFCITICCCKGFLSVVICQNSWACQLHEDSCVVSNANWLSSVALLNIVTSFVHVSKCGVEFW